MKKLTRMLMMLGMASVLVFSSCSKDEETIEDATITITPSPTGALSIGDVLTLTIEFKGNDNNKLKSYTVTRTGTSAPISSGNLTGTTNTTVVRDTMETSGTFTYIVSLVSEKGTVTKDYSLTIGVPTNLVIAQSFAVLGNQVDSKRKFWSGARSTSTTPALYFLADAVGNADLQGDIDFGYVTRTVANGGNKLVSPNSADATAIYGDQWSSQPEKITNWTVRNNTTFIQTTINPSEFTNATADTAIVSLINKAKALGEPNNQSVPALDDKVYLYKTASGLYGLIHVIIATGTVNGTTPQAGDVTIAVKYEQLP
jgi:hypothetical protein